MIQFETVVSIKIGEYSSNAELPQFPTRYNPVVIRIFRSAPSATECLERLGDDLQATSKHNAYTHKARVHVRTHSGNVRGTHPRVFVAERKHTREAVETMKV